MATLLEMEGSEMRRFIVLPLLFLFAVQTFAGVIEKLNLAEVDDDSIQIASPVWDGSRAGPILVGKIDSTFDRTVVRKLGGGFRNATIASQTLAPQLDLGEVLATALRSEGKALGLTMMEPQQAMAPQWVVGGTIRDAVVEVQHMGYGSLLFYAYLDVDLSVAKEGAAASAVRMRTARLFVLFNGGLGTGDEAQLALTKMLILGAQQILARLNREYFGAPALPAIETRLATLKKITDQEGDLHLIGLSGSHAAAAALTAMLVKEKDENARTSIVYALADLAPAEQAPLLIQRYVAEDTDVRYATLLALDAIGSEAAIALVRDKGTKDKNLAIKRLAERIVAAR